MHMRLLTEQMLDNKAVHLSGGFSPIRSPPEDVHEHVHRRRTAAVVAMQTDQLLAVTVFALVCCDTRLDLSLPPSEYIILYTMQSVKY
jgi:hypothetical protein